MSNKKNCEHFIGIDENNISPKTSGCEECEKEGTDWVALRMCLLCGHVGCCDSSPNKHATKHYHRSGHPVIISSEPGERWLWCYKDSLIAEY